MFSLDKYKKWFTSHEDEIKKQFTEFLSFRSISTDPLHAKSCQETAEWLSGLLQNMGLEVDLLTSSGQPVVFGEFLPKKCDTSVLVYHHYDVQPVDPMHLWQSDPFQARWENERVFARGASDNKGQCWITLTALRAFLSLEEEVPLHIKLFIEGEEESGSKGTTEVLHREAHRLQADHLCVIDFDLASPGIPAIALGYRGLVTLEVEYSNASTDLHSGVHGGMASNPIHMLAKVIHRIWDDRGRVTIPSFYEGILVLSQEERNKIDFSFDEEAYKQEYDIGVLCQEEGFSVREGGWIRPTVEFNGIFGGYTGEGFKTVLPAKAGAKVSCRLVPGQDPEKIGRIVASFFCEQAPRGVRVKVECHHGAPALFCSPDTSLVRTVAGCLEDVFQTPCRYTLCGGSVPIVQELAKAVGGDVALFGFALASDNIHAPNEHFR
ncbi:MAG: M20 family dipeptidase, partial [Chlamydiae bacterium]|nr:M20 family dipeptidase [Chlamydiota bacterium]